MVRMKSSWKISFFILCFGAFLDWMSYGLVYPIFAVSIFHQDPIFLSLEPTALRGFWLGVLLAASPLAQFLSVPAIGALSDKKGRKPILQISSLLIILGYLLSGLGIWRHSLFFLILGRVVTGVGAGNIAVINSSMADMSSPTAKARNFAWITMANGLGFAVGPWLGGKLSVGGFDIPFIFAAILTAVNFLLITFLFAETHHKKQAATSLGSPFNLPSYHPLVRAWKVLDNFFALEQRRRDIIEEEEKRITEFILVSVKKHIYYMQFFIDILLIIIGIVIGWVFAKY